MTVQSVTGTSSTNVSSSPQTGFAALGQQDFFKLLTVQMQMQDPFDPVDNKEMLAQMAQFSSLAGISDMGDTLTSISSKLDALIELYPADSNVAPVADTTATDQPAAETASDTQSQT